jgi:oxygen-independent coproporphyrinogen III oxidase
MLKSLLIKKYNVPSPRYTSYPTVPYWEYENWNQQTWLSTIQQNFNRFKNREISLYIHLPFCESLCTFCGCHKRITKNHSVEIPYLKTVLKEWDLYLKKLPFTPIIKELHFGGGTPTFFQPENLNFFLTELFKGQKKESSKVEFSFEAHPSSTSAQHLEVLYRFGFSRLSIGIQDYNEEVQKAIHRIQTFEQIETVHMKAKEIGFKSISHDLVYGLPKQKMEHIEYNVAKTLELSPDRISLYSYAHVPWVKGNGQRGFNESDLPKDEEKRALYEKAKSLLENAGYFEVGMDHFALPEDELYKSFKNKLLHRNFMGYTTQFSNLLIGLGVSSISDSWFGFNQNLKNLDQYTEKVENGEFPIEKGHFLSTEDIQIRRHILDLMCTFETKIPLCWAKIEVYKKIIHRLKPMFEDGLVKLRENRLIIENEGIPFVRNVCLAFDLKLHQTKKAGQLFSQTV